MVRGFWPLRKSRSIPQNLRRSASGGERGRRRAAGRASLEVAGPDKRCGQSVTKVLLPRDRRPRGRDPCCSVGRTPSVSTDDRLTLAHVSSSGSADVVVRHDRWSSAAGGSFAQPALLLLLLQAEARLRTLRVLARLPIRRSRGRGGPMKLAAGTLLRRPSASHPGPRPCRAERWSRPPTTLHWRRRS